MKNLLHIAQTVTLSIIAACFISGCGLDGEDDDQVNLRFINAVSDVSGVDLLVDGDVWIEDQEYLKDSGYFTFDSDQHLFQVVPSDSLTPISNLITALSDDKDYTYIAMGSALDATALMLVDNNERAGSGAFKLRVIDAWQSLQSVSVYVVASGGDFQNSAPAAKSLRYRSVTSYLTGKSGGYDIIVTYTNSGDVLARLPNQTFDSENVYTMIIAQSSTREGTPVLQLIDDSKD